MDIQFRSVSTRSWVSVFKKLVACVAGVQRGGGGGGAS